MDKGRTVEIFLAGLQNSKPPMARAERIASGREESSLMPVWFSAFETFGHAEGVVSNPI
jgi:hypothetical protein